MLTDLGVIQWGESLFLVLSWCGYIGVLMYNNRVMKLLVQLMSWMGLANAEEMMYEQLKPSLQRKETHSLLTHQSSDSEDGAMNHCDDEKDTHRRSSSMGHRRKRPHSVHDGVVSL